MLHHFTYRCLRNRAVEDLFRAAVLNIGVSDGMSNTAGSGGVRPNRLLHEFVKYEWAQICGLIAGHQEECNDKDQNEQRPNKYGGGVIYRCIARIEDADTAFQAVIAGLYGGWLR